MASTEHPPRHEGGPGNSRHLNARRQGRDMHACASPHPFVSPARQVGSAHPPDRAHALPHRPVGFRGVPGRKARGERARGAHGQTFAASGPGDRESPTAQPVAAPAPNPQPRLAVPAASLEGCCREAGCHPADAALRWDPGLPTGATTSGLSGSPSQDACQSVWDLRVCGEDTLRDLHTAHLIQVNNQAAAGLD